MSIRARFRLWPRLFHFSDGDLVDFQDRRLADFALFTQPSFSLNASPGNVQIAIFVTFDFWTVDLGITASHFLPERCRGAIFSMGGAP
jgi:hypothetical protein